MINGWEKISETLPMTFSSGALCTSAFLKNIYFLFTSIIRRCKKSETTFQFRLTIFCVNSTFFWHRCRSFQIILYVWPVLSYRKGHRWWTTEGCLDHWLLHEIVPRNKQITRSSSSSADHPVLFGKQYFDFSLLTDGALLNEITFWNFN